MLIVLQRLVNFVDHFLPILLHIFQTVLFNVRFIKALSINLDLCCFCLYFGINLLLDLQRCLFSRLHFLNLLLVARNIHLNLLADCNAQLYLLLAILLLLCQLEALTFTIYCVLVDLVLF